MPYPTEDAQLRIEVRLENGTVWRTQKQIADLFQVTIPTVNEHLKNIFSEGEKSPEATIRKFRIVQNEGAREVARLVDFDNLEVILAVGYRVRSPRGTQFRIWATERLREYLVKGFVLDDERLKNPPGPGVPDHFDELLERIRDIRASERRMYLRVREILALAADYKPGDEETQIFFQTVQNKLHFAVTGKTAPELIAKRADAAKPNMGLTTWKGAVVRKGDVTTAKNFLHENEITELNRIVTMFLDFAEDQASRRKQVFMRDWRSRLNDFLKFNERGVLRHAGDVSREDADRFAHKQYALFEKRRRAELEAKAEAETAARTGLSAKLKIDVEQAEGVKRKAVTVKRNGDDLFTLSGRRELYRGYTVTEINAESGFVSFGNGVRLHAGESQGGHNDAVLRVQVEETVREHFKKEMALRGRPAGERIKVLSLFFIDRVAHSAPADGKIRKWFVEAYGQIAAEPKFAALKPLPVEDVHNGYFAADKDGVKDSREGKSSKADDEAYHLIMEAKEKLLAPDVRCASSSRTRRCARAGTIRTSSRFARCAKARAR